MPNTTFDYFLTQPAEPLNKSVKEAYYENTVTSDFEAQTPHAFPFDIYVAYEIRLLSFFNGAIYALNHDDSITDRAKKYNAIEQLKEAKLEDLRKFKEKTNRQPVSFGSELYDFYHKELPKASGLKPKQIALAESFYVWQNIKRPRRITAYNRPLQGDEAPAATGRLRIVQIETPKRSTLTDKQKAELLTIHESNPKKKPKWFKKLDQWAQNALLSIVPEPQDVNPNWSNYQKCRPSALRQIPGEANASTHELQVSHFRIEPDEMISWTGTSSERQGVPTSFNIKDKQERQTSANENLGQMLTKDSIDKAYASFLSFWGFDKCGDNKPAFPILLGGLVTPSEQAGIVSTVLDASGASGDENNTRLAREKDQALRTYIELNYKGHDIVGNSTSYQISNNRDKIIQFFNLNVAINGELSIPVKPDAAFIDFLTNFVAVVTPLVGQKHDRLHQLSILNAIIERLNTITNEGLDGRNRNLYLAALYETAITAMRGLATGNCKSSKDRKGVELMMADAITIYCAEQRALGEAIELPRSDEVGPKRTRLVEIFCELYASGHQLLVAHDNSPGSPGIKDEGILDQDIIEKLQNMQQAPSANAEKTSKKDPRGLYAQSKLVAEFNKPGTFWKKFGGRICRYAAVAAVVILAGVSIGLMATGVLSPLGIIGAAAAVKLGIAATAVGVATNVAVAAAGATATVVVACKIRDGVEAYRDAGTRFEAQIQQAKKLKRSAAPQARIVGVSTYQVSSSLNCSQECSSETDPATLEKRKELLEPLLDGLDDETEPSKSPLSSLNTDSQDEDEDEDEEEEKSLLPSPKLVKP